MDFEGRDTHVEILALSPTRDSRHKRSIISALRAYCHQSKLLISSVWNLAWNDSSIRADLLVIEGLHSVDRDQTFFTALGQGEHFVPDENQEHVKPVRAGVPYIGPGGWLHACWPALG